MILHKSIYKDETGEVFLEKDNGLGIFIHCYSYKWTKESYKHYKNVWQVLLNALEEQGIPEVKAARHLEDEKLKKFAEKFGFKDTDELILDSEGNTRRVMKCSFRRVITSRQSWELKGKRHGKLD